MPTIVPPVDIIVAGTAVSLGGIGDTLFVMDDIDLISTGGIGARLFSNNHAIVHGSIHGDAHGIVMGEEVAGGSVFVGDTGNVSGTNGSAITGGPAGTGNGGTYSITNNGDLSNNSVNGTIEIVAPIADPEFFRGGQTSITNAGLIANTYSPQPSTAIRVINAGSTVQITNTETGVITAAGENSTAIRVLGQSTFNTELEVEEITEITFVNAGEVFGGRFAYNSDGRGVDIVTNSGWLGGNVSLGVDDDSFTNTGGTVDGILFLGAGNDVFDGRGGIVAGRVEGGSGNDTYLIDDSDITLFEAFGQGNDAVFAAASYALLGNFEDLTLLGSDDLNGFGNDQANQIEGNSGNNRLFGDAGTDQISGMAGNDWIDGGSSGDTLDGGTGDDRILGRRGADQADGGSGDDTLLGNRGNDSLDGGDGNDRLIGGEGVDTLTGGDGEDEFVYKTVSASPSSAPDEITDFVVGTDKLDLSLLTSDPITLELLGVFTGTGPSLRTAEIAGDTRVNIDVDGDGVADMRIVLVGTTGLMESDFIL
ncbi:MAG: M10 family metallopeptidase C-terminal domain-containing protein [Rhodobacter sp.]|nr:M10 family metallopeptidase C-terminal domain-containing protein [Rhodobacter sp.]